MLENTGPYGPNEVPINMGSSRNIPSRPSASIGHNLNNFNQMHHQPMQTSGGHFNVPNYSNFMQQPYSINTESTGILDYQNPGFQSSFLTQNSAFDHETISSVQSGMLPMNLNIESCHSFVNYNGYDIKNKVRDAINTDNIYSKTSPLNIPQIHIKTFQKHDDNTKTLVDQRNDYIQSKDLTAESNKMSTLDDSKRRSLENTVRLIEKILINSSTKPKNVEKDVEIIEEDIEATSLKVEFESLSEDSECEETVQVTEQVLIKTEPIDDTVMIKVESSSWVDMEYYYPFRRDLNSISRNDVEGTIINAEKSIAIATETAANELNSSHMFFECPYCNLIFEHPKRFLIHTKWHSFASKVVLPKEKDVKRTLGKEENKAEILKRVADPPEAVKYQCKDCNQVFSGKSSLQNHRTISHGSHIKECRVCFKPVAGRAALQAHMVTHKSDTLYQCADCPKKFKYVHSLTKHRDIHMEKIFQCPKCPKMFGTESRLKIHEKCHDKSLRKAAYSCSYCAKPFYEVYSLQAHERTHRNEKPFSCDICHASYGTNSSLQRHIKVSHSKLKPYECATCHRCFKSEHIKKSHEIRTHGKPEDLQFPCKLCTNRYGAKKDLRKHIYKAHPKRKRRKDKSDSE